MVNNSTAFVGLDLGDKRSNAFILDPEGELIEEIRIPTNESAFRRKFASLPPCRVAMEAHPLPLGQPLARATRA
jgi:hypothetical protein